MEAKPLLKPVDAAHRLGCGLDRFRRQYVLADPADQFVGDTELKRLEPIKLYWFWRGLRLCQLKKPMAAFIAEEVDALVAALKMNETRRATTPAGSQTFATGPGAVWDDAGPEDQRGTTSDKANIRTRP